MNQQEILDALAGLSLFSDLDRPQLQAVAHIMSEESFPPRQRILRQGFSGSGFFVILDGEVAVCVDGEDVATLGKGDVFGEMAIVTGTKRNADVVATSAMILASMMIWDFREMVGKHTEIQQRLDRLVAERTDG